ncbi:YgcG family protein [Sinimarinibacterium sp. NLF-5-8]|uniref:TPM domain-containing protein n=1 Tax=Sinimarinibacterium sp. NLF-5-8 TaxID=2698684 RepID=UPI00137C2563|nr:TPM domain-containing protein [Sinimarinibacterium sp. NLF-5-8]QHS10850.1 YgcG family protein [Sinimarinibacterium sp. NLF-5-8]
MSARSVRRRRLILVPDVPRLSARARWVLLLCLLALNAWAQLGIPPVARVTDQTHTLSSAQISELSAQLAAFEQAKGSQIALLMVATTAPETIEQYSLRVAENWQLGRKGVDDGALLLVALDDRALRVEVGYGLEGALPDATAKRIIEEIIVPRFKNDDVFGGVKAGIEQMIRVIDGEPLPEPQTHTDEDAFEAGFAALLIGVLVGGQWLRARLGAWPAASLVGTAVFITLWLLTHTLIFAIPAAALAFLLTWIKLEGGGGGFGSSGGSGGGGFSGGGGSFGGGGASGRW